MEPKDLKGVDLALWMMHELEVERWVEVLRELYPDETLSDLRKRGEAQTNALRMDIHPRLAGGYRARELLTSAALFVLPTDRKNSQADELSVTPVDEVREGLQDIAAGRVREFTNVRDLLHDEPVSEISDKVRGAHNLARWLVLAVRALIGGRR